ncbi:MAG: hypothetical protein ACXABY_04860 [Candidatus Thorarchaeota archaeon]|jgi:hypothetical protein
MDPYEIIETCFYAIENKFNDVCKHGGEYDLATEFGMMCDAVGCTYKEHYIEPFTLIYESEGHERKVETRYQVHVNTCAHSTTGGCQILDFGPLHISMGPSMVHKQLQIQVEHEDHPEKFIYIEFNEDGTIKEITKEEA